MWSLALLIILGTANLDTQAERHFVALQTVEGEEARGPGQVPNRQDPHLQASPSRLATRNTASDTSSNGFTTESNDATRAPRSIELEQANVSPTWLPEVFARPFGAGARLDTVLANHGGTLLLKAHAKIPLMDVAVHACGQTWAAQSRQEELLVIPIPVHEQACQRWQVTAEQPFTIERALLFAGAAAAYVEEAPEHYIEADLARSPGPRASPFASFRPFFTPFQTQSKESEGHAPSLQSEGFAAGARSVPESERRQYAARLAKNDEGSTAALTRLDEARIAMIAPH
ncbi:MAG: hypothetical protein RBU37_14240 [Myxococcota bacterium]|jgi:hypothetical protein|nr:hypothetical protein [Myxococcota bacterium]